MANKMLDRLRMEREAGRVEGGDVEGQYCMDVVFLALHDLYGFGPDRINRLAEKVQEYHTHFNRVFRVGKNDEDGRCEQLRNEFDNALRQCVDPERFAPFEDRYPTIKTIKY